MPAFYILLLYTYNDRNEWPDSSVESREGQNTDLLHAGGQRGAGSFQRACRAPL